MEILWNNPVEKYFREKKIYVNFHYYYYKSSE